MASSFYALRMELPSVMASSYLGVTQLDVGAAAKPPARAVLTPIKDVFGQTIVRPYTK